MTKRSQSCSRLKKWMARSALAVFALAISLGAQEKPAQEKPPGPSRETREADSGRPVLRRGGPAQKRETPAPSATPIPSRAPVQAGDEIEVDEQGRTVQTVRAGKVSESGPSLVDRVRQAAYEFDQSLPNFLCDEQVMRFESRTLKPDWKYLDRIDVELLYLEGKEEYRNIRRNGKPLKKEDPEKSGSWSTGEFGSTLIDILSSSSQARFEYKKDSSIGGRPVKIYTFRVEQPNSNWRIRFGPEVKPAYNGSLWIDPESARVLRIEKDSNELPPAYPFDKVETVVDYGWVPIGGTRYLLPTRSESLACERGSFNCSKIEIEFRNYRKFAVESQVLATDSEISFPEAEESKKPAEPKKKK